MILETKGYSYNDLTIIPEEISDVESRSQCNPFVSENKLPIFASPMASVVDDANYDTFINNYITPIIPRNIDIKTRILKMNEQKWVALSLREFEDLFINNYKDRIEEIGHHYYICVDIANGHMKSLYEKCREAKNNAVKGGYKLTIMTGNIANPETYKWIINYNDNYGKIIDYIRVGIGGGCGCITTSNTSAHYPQASLINECYKIKDYWKTYISSRDIVPYIVADGGIRNYDHVIKALALGADYVMIGSLFAQCIESAGIKYMGMMNNSQMKFNYDAYVEDSLYIDSNGNWMGRIKQLRDEDYIGELNVKFFGMASADGQKSISGKKTKTSEGITKYLPVKYTLSGWVKNMVSYLQSAMSYTDCKTLTEFIGKPKLIPNSISEIQAVNK